MFFEKMKLDGPPPPAGQDLRGSRVPQHLPDRPRVSRRVALPPRWDSARARLRRWPVRKRRSGRHLAYVVARRLPIFMEIHGKKEPPPGQRSARSESIQDTAASMPAGSSPWTPPITNTCGMLAVNSAGDFLSSAVVGLLWSAFGPTWAFGYSALLFIFGAALVARVK